MYLFIPSEDGPEKDVERFTILDGLIDKFLADIEESGVGALYAEEIPRVLESHIKAKNERLMQITKFKSNP